LKSFEAKHISGIRKPQSDARDDRGRNVRGKEALQKDRNESPRARAPLSDYSVVQKGNRNDRRAAKRNDKKVS